MAQTWQEKLKEYETNINTAANEIARAESVAKQKAQAGDIAGAEAAKKWVEQIKSVAGKGSMATTQPTTTQQTTAATAQDASTAQLNPLKTDSIASGGLDYQKELESVYSKLQAGQLAGINTKYDSQLSALNTQASALPETYRQAGISAESASRKGAKSFSEYLAAKGLGQSGEAGQGELSRTIALQNTQSGLAQELAQKQADIQAQKASLESSRAGEIQSVGGTIGAELAQKLLSYKQTQSEQQKQNEISNIGQYSNDYQAEINRRQATPDTSDDYLIPYLQTARADKLKSIEQAGISQYSNDYQAEINRRLATPDKNDDLLIPSLQAARNQKIEQQTAQQAAQADVINAQAKQQQQIVDNAFELLKQVGVANDYVASVLGIPVGTKTADYINMVADNAKKSSSASSQTNLLKSRTSTNTSISSLDSRIASNFINKTTGTVDKYGIAEYIKGLWNSGALGDTEADAQMVLALLDKYGASNVDTDWQNAVTSSVNKAQGLAPNLSQAIR